MKIKELLETDMMSMISMVTQGIRFVELDPKEVEVKFKKHQHAKQKDCFNNAFRHLSDHPHAKFVFGYVFYHGIPIEHAWVKEGTVHYDVTLDPKGQDGYVSLVEYDFNEVMEFVDAFGHAPSLFDMNRFLGKK